MTCNVAGRHLELGEGTLLGPPAPEGNVEASFQKAPEGGQVMGLEVQVQGLKSDASRNEGVCICPESFYGSAHFGVLSIVYPYFHTIHRDNLES